MKVDEWESKGIETSDRRHSTRTQAAKEREADPTAERG